LNKIKLLSIEIACAIVFIWSIFFDRKSWNLDLFRSFAPKFL